MKNKMTIMLVLVVMLSLAGNASAYVYSWCSSSGNWADAARWDVMPSPAVEGNALIYNGAVLDVTTAGQGAWDLALGYQGAGTVNIATGIEFDVTGNAGVGQDPGGVGILNINGTAHFAGLAMGYGGNATGTINVNSGGLLKVGLGGWAINIGIDAASHGTINLKGNGSMEVEGDGGWHMNLNDGRGHIDIEAGQLKVLGDRQTELHGFINNGWITSRGGSSPHCSLVVSYLDGYTYVKTTGCTCTTNLAADLNKDCYVDMSDLAFLAQNWLNCTVSTDPNCVQ